MANFVTLTFLGCFAILSLCSPILQKDQDSMLKKIPNNFCNLSVTVIKEKIKATCVFVSELDNS